MYKQLAACFKVGLLIPGKLHSRVESRDSRVSFETLDFARVHTSGVIGVGSSAERKGVVDAGPHCRLRTITQPAVACSKHCKTPPPPRRRLLDNWSSSRAPGRWARLTAGSSRVSGAVAHVSKCELGMRRRGELRSSTGRRVWETRGLPRTRPDDRPISRVSLTCLVKSHCVFVLRATIVKFTTETCCRRSLTITCDTAVECRPRAACGKLHNSCGHVV